MFSVVCDSVQGVGASIMSSVCGDDGLTTTSNQDQGSITPAPFLMTHQQLGNSICNEISSREIMLILVFKSLH